MLSSQDIRAALAAVTYKPHYAFHFTESREGWTMWITCSAMPNAYRPDEPFRFEVETFIPRYLADVEAFYDWLAWRLEFLEAHEAREWFRVNGKPWSDPHAERLCPVARDETAEEVAARYPPGQTPHSGY